MSSGRTPRLFVDEELKDGVATALGPDAARYLGSVLRLGAGADVLLFDDRNGEWRATIVEIGKRGAVLRPAARTRERERVPDIWLCAAPIKRARFEWMAEKACELGAARFVPVVTAHTEVRGVRAERLRAHMIEAAEQCERTAIPALGDMIPLDALLRDWPADRALIFCDEETAGDGGADAAAAAALNAMPGEPAAILIGPEGGFNADERARIAAHPASVRVSLGPRILRADTAAVAALSLWQAAQGDWR